MLKTFLRYYKPYKGIMFLLIAGSLLRALLEIFFPYVVKQMLELRLPLEDLPLLLQWGAGLAVMYLASFAIHYGVNYYGLTLSANMENDMRRDLFLHLQQMSFGFFDKNKTGQLLARLTGDLGEIGELACRAPNDLAVCSLTMLGTMGILVYINPFLGGLIALLLLLKTIHTIWVNQRMKTTFFSSRTAQGEMTAKASESLNGVRLIKAFAAEAEDRDAFMEKAGAYVAARKDAFRIRSYFMGTLVFFSNFINLAVLVCGGILIHRGQMTFGELVAYFLYVSLFMKPLMQLLLFSDMYQKGMAGFRRFYEVMEAKPEIEDLPGAVECRDCRGRIDFENVTFGYREGQPVIRNLSMTVLPGETVAFVGATGAGKTTIASLLLRFYEPQAGRILLDGRDIREYTQESLRRQIGLVQQDVFLFSDSVRHNIAYGKWGADDREIRKAAAAASADGFIENLPQQYDTEIGERGVTLSGGQKQRLAIARVFLKDPPVLVLDEATSSLDNRTERQIQAELEKLAAGRTTLVIAHRLSTVRKADKILVLENGTIRESGSWQQLLEQKGLFYRLYRSQDEEKEE